jgi:hypothetical protein
MGLMFRGQMEASWTIANLLTGGRAVRVDATVEPGIYSLDAVRKNLGRPSRRIHCVQGPRDRGTYYLVAPLNRRRDWERMTAFFPVMETGQKSA